MTIDNVTFKEINPAEINPQLITQARQSRGLTQSALAKQINISQGALSKIEAGVSLATLEDLHHIAEALDYPPHFFLQHIKIHGPGISELFHRKRQKLSATKLNKIYALADIRRTEISKLLRSWNLPEVDFPRMPIDEFDEKPEKIARTVRALWALPTGPIHSMTQVIEDAGGVIVQHDFDTRQIDGFSQRLDGIPPIFHMNKQLAPDRWRWTLAHELGHLVMHFEVDQAKLVEEQADRFAGEFLAPAHEIKPQLWELSFQKLAGLKRYWKISMQALIMIAYRLGVINDRKRRYMFMQIGKAGYRLQEPPELDPPKEPPQLLTAIAQYHVQDLGYSDSELRHALAVGAKDYESYYTPAMNLRVIK
jgi:Zn-dependent peptidase ImmA (M78 family)/DNA-binding XRE family transcriptional regulator